MISGEAFFNAWPKPSMHKEQIRWQKGWVKKLCFLFLLLKWNKSTTSLAGRFQEDGEKFIRFRFSLKNSVTSRKQVGDRLEKSLKCSKISWHVFNCKSICFSLTQWTVSSNAHNATSVSKRFEPWGFTSRSTIQNTLNSVQSVKRFLGA